MNYPSASFSSLIRLTAPENHQWVNKTGSDVLVNWVVIEPNLAVGGEVLLLEASRMTPNKVAIAAKNKIAAIMLVGELDNPKAFENATIPIAVLLEGDDYQETYRMVLTILINQRAHLMEWGNSINARLTKQATDGSGLEQIAKQLSELSGKAILLQDKRMDTLAQYIPPTFTDSKEIIFAGMKDLDSLPEKLRDRKEAAQEQQVFDQNLSESYERLVIPINVGEMARGYLSLIGHTGEFDAIDRVVIEHGAETCATVMARSKAVREAEKRIKGDWLTALIHGELTTRDARLWTQEMGLDLENAHVCLRFCWDAAIHPSFRRLETMVNAEVARENHTVIVSQMEEEVVCIIEVKLGSHRPEEALSLGRAVLDKAILTYSDANPRCGIGMPINEFSEWNTSFRQAGQALEMAKRLGEFRPLFFPDLSVYRLLMLIEHSDEVRTFYEDLLGPLLNYDNGEELIKTLEIYFERNGNLKKSANALFIHRNTLLYRLERIQEITGLDLSNPETRLALQLTLRIHKMLGSRKEN